MDIQHLALDALCRLTGDEHPYDMENAAVFVVSHDDRCSVITEHPDVYAALETIRTNVGAVDRRIAGQPLGGARALGVVTCGWAAPLRHQNTPPSSDPARRRVRLAVIATTDLVTGSAVEFQDEPEQPILDGGSATGALHDTLLDAVRAIVDYQLEISGGR